MTITYLNSNNYYTVHRYIIGFYYKLYILISNYLSFTNMFSALCPTLCNGYIVVNLVVNHLGKSGTILLNR